MTNERWAAIPGYELLYEVSDQGQIRSLDRTVEYSDGRIGRYKGRILKLNANGDGYLGTRLTRHGTGATVYAHRLVAQVFVQGRAPGLEVCHNDGDKRNNAWTNLRWGTRAENMLDTVTHGTNRFATRTHCMKGHEYTPENTAMVGRHRACRECRRLASRRRRARTKADSGRPNFEGAA